MSVPLYPLLECSRVFQGIRGIASIFIMTGHCVRAIIPNYLSPADEYGATPHLFQRPFLRIFASGPFWTSIFFLLSGYVCAIKPLRLSAAGQPDEARKVIASSAFRRLPRIGVPATLGTIFGWALCQLHAFNMVGETTYYSEWLRYTIPEPTPGFLASISDLVLECYNTWATSENRYEGNQWTLCWEMRGSMLLFLVLSMTAGFTVFWRRFMLIAAAFYYFKSGELLSPFLFFSGALLAEIALVQKSRASVIPTFTQGDVTNFGKIVANYWPIALALFALLLASVPPENAHYIPYSRVIWYWFDDHVNTTGGENDRTIGAFGGIMLILAIMFSPFLRRILSHPSVIYLGGISFPLFLLHGTWVRLFLAWIVYRFLAQFPSLNIVEYREAWDGNIRVFMLCPSITCKFVTTVVFCLWLGSLLAVCRLWKDYIDILGVRCSRWAEDVVLGKGGLIESVSFPKPEVNGDWLSGNKLNNQKYRKESINRHI